MVVCLVFVSQHAGGKPLHAYLFESTQIFREGTVEANDQRLHAFAYWDLPVDGIEGHTTVKETVLDFLETNLPR
jgi:hypothetical protein